MEFGHQGQVVASSETAWLSGCFRVVAPRARQLPRGIQLFADRDLPTPAIAWTMGRRRGTVPIREIEHAGRIGCDRADHHSRNRVRAGTH